MDSLNLPRELVERILLLLGTKSMLKCRLVNKQFNAILQSSMLMQYHLACDAAGVIDNPQSPLSYAERLSALKKREDAWRELKPVFETTIETISDQSSMFYELTAGNYFLDDENQEDLYYCSLPSSSQDNPQWRRISDHGPEQSLSGSIIEMGAAVYEHDIVVMVISSELDGNLDMWERYSLDLVLLKFSTGEYHPLARHPLVHVQKSPSSRPDTTVRIVGDSLALVVQYDDESQLFIFDWKTGHKRLQHKADETAYQYIVPIFVSPEILLVPNRIEAHFEVWHLFPSNSNTPVQILSLQIPAVSDNYSIFNIRCHGEPSPFLHSMPYLHPRPFLPSSEDSIIIVSIILHLRPRLGMGKSFQLVMHRRMLLDMIQKWTSLSLLEQAGLAAWWTNQVTVHELIDPDDRSVRFSAQSYSCGVWSSYPDSSPILGSSPSSISSGSALFTSPVKFRQVKWADWGPLISRWFPMNGKYGAETWYDRPSTGQRYVFLNRNPDPGKRKICVADFNLYNVKKNAEMVMQLRGGKGRDNGGNVNNGEEEKDEDESEILDHNGVFSEEVHMGLKCVVYHMPVKYHLDVVMMDEERLLGLILDDDWRRDSLGVRRTKVFYIG